MVNEGSCGWFFREAVSCGNNEALFHDVVLGGIFIRLHNLFMQDHEAAAVIDGNDSGGFASIKPRGVAIHEE
jgi:hypothetical protein